MNFDDSTPRRYSPIARYLLALTIFEGVTKHLGNVADVIADAADILRNPSGLSHDRKAYGAVWMTAADMNHMLHQWQVQLGDVWSAWNQLSPNEKAQVRGPGYPLMSPSGSVFKDR